MHELQDLRRNLVALVDQDGRRRCEEEAVREQERQVLDALRATFECAASEWIEQVVPRLEMLVELLPAVGGVERVTAGWKAAVTLPSSPEFPVAASLTMTITPVDGYRLGRVAIEPLLIPMLQGHPRAATRDFDLASPVAASEIARFLDEGVLTFARAYLHVRDPESPYQTGRSSRREAEGSQPPAAIEEPAVTV